MNEVTHSTEAVSAPAVRYVDRQRRALPNGWWGMAILIATEATLFGCLIGTYFYLRSQVGAWPPPGIEPPDVDLPLAITGALVATSVPMFLAARFARRGMPEWAWRLVLLAVLVQCGYLATQAHLFLSDLDKFSPKATSYGAIYFTLLGTHHVHVIVGILLNLWLLLKLATGLTNYRAQAVRAIALYWHFVNVAAIAVVLTQCSPSL